MSHPKDDDYWTFEALFAIARHDRFDPVGGCTHIATEDLNLRDEDLDFCIAEGIKRSDWIGLAVAALLRSEPEERRRLLLAEMTSGT